MRLNVAPALLGPAPPVPTAVRGEWADGVPRRLELDFGTAEHELCDVALDVEHGVVTHALIAGPLWRIDAPVQNGALHGAGTAWLGAGAVAAAAGDADVRFERGHLVVASFRDSSIDAARWVAATAPRPLEDWIRGAALPTPARIETTSALPAMDFLEVPDASASRCDDAVRGVVTYTGWAAVPAALFHARGDTSVFHAVMPWAAAPARRIMVSGRGRVTAVCVFESDTADPKAVEFAWEVGADGALAPRHADRAARARLVGARAAARPAGLAVLADRIEVEIESGDAVFRGALAHDADADALITWTRARVCNGALWRDGAKVRDATLDVGTGTVIEMEGETETEIAAAEMEAEITAPAAEMKGNVAGATVRASPRLKKHDAPRLGEFVMAKLGALCAAAEPIAWRAVADADTGATLSKPKSHGAHGGRRGTVVFQLGAGPAWDAAAPHLGYKSFLAAWRDKTREITMVTAFRLV